MTVSIGVASGLPTEATSATGLIGTADAGLYDAKRRGRNRAAAHSPVEMRVAS
ncbi:MAG: GGDEF domain-containing protein [Hyphomicrobiaceae bacterium]|nr:MAG: GGDEF domain-containing protein [Hyphomicrobiaceae bacterium]